MKPRDKSIEKKYRYVPFKNVFEPESQIASFLSCAVGPAALTTETHSIQNK